MLYVVLGSQDLELWPRLLAPHFQYHGLGDLNILDTVAHRVSDGNCVFDRLATTVVTKVFGYVLHVLIFD